MKEFEREAKLYTDVPCWFETRMGLAADVIVRKAQSIRADLIVIGTRTTDTNSVVGNILGGITTAVIEQQVCAVMAIPITADVNTFGGTIVFGADYLEIRNPQTLHPLMDIAKAFDASIHILNANPVPENLEADEPGEEQLERLLDGYKVCFDYSDEADVEHALQHCVAEENASLLVMIARQRGLWQGLFHQSHTRRMALHTQVPLLVLVLPDLL